MQPPRDNSPKKPGTTEWKQRRGTSISLGSIGQSALRPSGGARPSLLAPKPAPVRTTPPPAPKPVPTPTTQTGAAPTRPAPLPPTPKPGEGGSPQVSRAFMSGSLVPPRPLGQRPQPQPMPEFPKREAPAARAAEPAPLPKPAPAARPAAPESTARPAAPRAHGIAPVSAPKPEAAPAPRAEPRPEPEVLAAATAAPVAGARRPAKNVRQFNAAMAADARGDAAAPKGFLANKALLGSVAVLAVAVVSFGGWWFLTQRPAGPGTGIGSVAANEVQLSPQAAAPATPAAAAADTVADVSTSAVTEAPSQADAEAPSVIAERPAGPPTNFGALAPKGAPAPAAPRAGRVVLADLPDSPDLGAATGRAEVETAPVPAAAPPPPAPVIRLPSGDEPFSTNTPNPDPGG